MPRKTDSNNPADWLFFSAADLDLLTLAAEHETSYIPSRSKLAEALEKVLKAELIRLGWPLLKTHELTLLVTELEKRGSDLIPLAQPLAARLAEDFMLGRYPGFDLEAADWPAFRADLEQVAALQNAVQARIASA